MATDPHAALKRLIAALEGYHAVVVQVQDPDDDDVLDAADELGDAFDDYDQILFDATGVDTPLDNLDDDDYDDSDEDIDEDDFGDGERDGVDL